jgi:ribosome-binding protein aMBF1 (putative translation factor)
MSASTSKPNRKRQFDYPRTPQECRKSVKADIEQQKEFSLSESEPVDYGKIIAEGRKRLGWSQKIFAYKSDYDEKTISNVETGNTKKPQTLCDLRDVVNIALKKKGEAPIPWPSLETTLALRETYEIKPVITASRISTLGRNAGYEHLIGRDNERKALDFAWDGDAEAWQNIFNQHAKNALKLTGKPLAPRIIVFSAWAGIGKTSLVVRWAADKLAQENHSGISRYFDWSFYSQGTRREDYDASAAVLLREALERFGDSALAVSNASAWRKGERLAQLIGQHRALLVLDGLEPLQDVKSGELRNDGLRALLRGLAAHNCGLCLVTTRQHVPELATWHHTTAPEWELDCLTDEAGAALLTKLGVNGTDREKRALSARIKGHALTLTLLGGYLKRAHHGDIRRVDRVDFQKVNEKEQGGHAFRVIAAYERWFKKDKCRAELAILRMLGLFDRPATPDCLAALRDPPIPGLTNTLASLTVDDWNEALTHLVELNLVEEQPWEPRRIIGYDEKEARLAKQGHKLGEPKLFENRILTFGIRNSLDTHPLIREFFTRQLKETNATMWKNINSRLFEHLRTCVPYWPEGLDGLQPLYQAVTHGCRAGLYFQACDKVYCDRILRGDSNKTGNYSTKKLGLIGLNLAALLSFFADSSWHRIVPGLNPKRQAWLLNEIAFHLRAINRLVEAQEPFRVSMNMAESQRDWWNAAIYASNLSQLELILGDLLAAEKIAARSIPIADKSRKWTQSRINRSTHANALLHLGRFNESKKRFIEAEVIQAKNKPDQPLLCSLPGFQYCDLLLSEVEEAAWLMFCTGVPRSKTCADKYKNILSNVEQRAFKALNVVKNDQWLLDISLANLTLGRVSLYRKILDLKNMNFSSAVTHLDGAVDSFIMGNRSDYLPRGLLSRAWLRTVQGQLDTARADLDEAKQIAERGPMRLHLADIHLHRARLFRDKEELKLSRDLIEQRDYWRRKKELEDAEEAARHW